MTEEISRYAYLIGIAVLAIVSELFYTSDYWRPHLFTGGGIGLEDLLFAFVIV